MDLLQRFLNLVIPPTALCVLLVLWPALTVRSIGQRLFKVVFKENVRGKIVAITGASSKLGQALAYQYAKRGAVLIVISLDQEKLRELAENCKKWGALDARAIRADVSKEEDCNRFIDEIINQYGSLDHLVNNAGIPEGFLFQESPDLAASRHIMETNFWGYVYPTIHALPHLKRSRGKIVVNASVVSWLPFPRLSMGGAAKAAVANFFDTLRVELGTSIGGITIVTPGWIESEMTMGKFINRKGNIAVREDMRDQQVGPLPIAYAEDCAKAIIHGVARGDRYVRFPYWYTTFLLYRVFAPEVLDTLLRVIYVLPAPGRKDRAPLSKVLLELPGLKTLLYGPSIRSVHESS
ncbi:hypothetical protein KP509_06G041200 [Ceratopteris richardii]|uniref:Uncharacterized protein n=1 Tax=Ceratopteris richardii TaxID=49495 RepID=A0A8T2UFB7_CERRI|nr:hypothetical protein KP509_06G041200 [Ceratopteris richardii]